MATIDKDLDEVKSAVKGAAKSASAEVSARVSKAAERVSDISDEVEDDLESRFAELREQVLVIRDQLEEFAADRMDDVKEVAAETLHQGGRAVRAAGRQANAVGTAVRNDPLPVIVGLGVIALLTALLVERNVEGRR